MARMNEQLDAAVDAFEAQTSANAVYVQKLRHALQTDDALLRGMNQAAKDGSLRSFVLDASQDSLIGRADIATGIVALPSSAFSGTQSSLPSLGAVLKLQEMSLRFGHSKYADAHGQQVSVSQEMVGNLQQSIGASPALLEKISLAVSARPEPHLKSFTILPDGQGMGAAYDGYAKTMMIPASRLQAETESNKHGFDPVSMVYALAHETEHSFNHERKQDAWREFQAEVKKIAKDDSPVNDYTAPVAKIIQASRVDEAEGEISGWNAVLSMKQKQDPSFNIEKMAETEGSRSYLYVKYDKLNRQYFGRNGLVFGEDASIAPTPENVEAVGKSYFDRGSKDSRSDSPELVGLGPHKEASYANYYGRNAIEQLITIDRSVAHKVGGVEPQMHLNMAALGLEERLVERLGLRVSPDPQERQPYYDTSQSPPALKHFDHTRTGSNLNEHVPIDPAILADEPLARTEARSTPAQPGHPDHTLYSQIVAQVKEQDRVNGRSWDQVSERLSASLLSLAKENGITRVDHVVFSQKTDQVAAGENVFIVQGQLNDPAHVRAHMKTEAAVQTPEVGSFQKVEAINERAAQQVPALQAQQLQEEPSRGFGR